MDNEQLKRDAAPKTPRSRASTASSIDVGEVDRLKAEVEKLTISNKVRAHGMIVTRCLVESIRISYSLSRLVA